MTVLVSVPFFGPQDLLRRAVRSILAQTHQDLRLVVIGDGQEPDLDAIEDPRLEVYTLPENRGPYFALQLALLANPHPWFAPHAADDWSDPAHLEQLLEVGGDAVITGAVWFHKGRRAVIHRAGYEVGLYATSRLRAMGGYNPAERMGQDTLLIRLLRLTGDVRATDRPTYHRVKRPGSLTTALETGIGSKARNEMRRRNRAVFAAAQALHDPAAIRAYREAIVPASIADELAHHGESLGARLAGRIAA